MEFLLGEGQAKWKMIPLAEDSTKYETMRGIDQMKETTKKTWLLGPL
jgi:hypothetical protein